MRNKHKDRRAGVNLYVDGEDVSQGAFIIGANSYEDIERPFNSSSKFKFVPWDSDEAYAEGKDTNWDGEKGVIEARFHLEKPVRKPIHIPPVVPNPYPNPWKKRGPSPYEPKWVNETVQYSNARLTSRGSSSLDFCAEEPGVVMAAGPAAEGCTVEGSKSSQRFRTVSIGLESDYVTLKLVLRGTNQKVERLAYCTRCGAKRKITANFCFKCGEKF